MRTILSAAVVMLVPLVANGDDKPPARAELLTASLGKLLEMQEPSGQWPYEGVYRVGGQIPVGYRIGGTSLVAETLIWANVADEKTQQAIAKALAFVLKELDHPLMVPSTAEAYDVRVWGHACALGFLCQVRAAKLGGEQASKVNEWIRKLVEALITEEIPGGGWNYANRRQQAAFVTAPVVQSLLFAKAQGEKVPDDLLVRARKALEGSRTAGGAFVYSGSAKNRPNEKLPASAARSAVCETTLVLLGGGSVDSVRGGLDAFHAHWDELKKRHQQTGTHVPPYSIAPYYFYYGHRYAAQAIEMLPESDRAAEREKLLLTVLKTRDKDGTWNDRVFARSKGYGTAMIVLTLLAEKAPMPPRMQAAAPGGLR